MSAKMTPGPWHWTVDHEEHNVRQTNSDRICAVGKLIDAKAIACLPELVEAAERAVTLLDRSGQETQFLLRILERIDRSASTRKEISDVPDAPRKRRVRISHEADE